MPRANRSPRPPHSNHEDPLRISSLAAGLAVGLTLLGSPAHADKWRAERPVIAEVLGGGVYVTDVARDRVLDLLPFGDPFSYPVARFTVFSYPLNGADGWSPLPTAGIPPPRLHEFAVAHDPGRDRMVLVGDFDP